MLVLDKIEATTAASAAPKERIAFIDGLRGVAISFVVLFHAYWRWNDLIPGDGLARYIPFVRYGWLGVELFFLISGFVILMTLNACDSFPTFILRRWMRLFPASLIVSLFLLLTAPLFPERPTGMPELRDIVPGLVFLHPDWLAFLFGGPQGQIEGAYWSLYVEVVFYIVFGVMYFIFGETRALVLMAALGLVAAIGHMLQIASLDQLSGQNMLGMKYYGWFVCGALAYKYMETKNAAYFLLACAAGVISPLTYGGARVLGAYMVAALFLAAMRSVQLRELLSRREIVWMGFISYPLYLLHENLLVASMIKLRHAAPWLPAIVTPLPPIAFVLLLGWLVARYVEPRLRALLRRPYLLMCRIAGAQIR